MKTDIKQDIGNRLVQMIKDMGEPIWRKPWVFAQPETAFGGKNYRGINQAMTAMYRMANGQKSHLWLTRKKIDELAGWKWDASKNRKVKDRDNKLNVYLRTGCHGVPIVYWSFIPKKDSDGNVMKDKEGNELPQGFVIARALDEITSMKILSRIEGDDTKVKESLLDNLMDAIKDGLSEIAGEEKLVESVSIAKLNEMKGRLNSGYTSFWS